MYKRMRVITVLICVFCLSLVNEVTAATASHRDAVSAQQPDATIGGGSIRNNPAVLTHIVNERYGAKANAQAQVPNPGVPDCAWKDEKFREAYLALATGNTSSSSNEGSSQGTSGAVTQGEHGYYSGSDGQGYSYQNISIVHASIDNVGSCAWADTQNAAMGGSQKHIYADKYAVVFPDDYNYYEGQFQCAQPLVYFCSPNIEVGKNAFQYWKTAGGHAFFADGNHIISGDYAFRDSTADFTIGKGSHYFTGERVFYSASGNVEIGEGDHIFGTRAFHSFAGVAYIGNALPGGGHFFQGEKTFHSLVGIIEIGDGNHEFSGLEAFAYPKATSAIYIGDGNHTITGTNAFRNITGIVSFGDGSHEFLASGIFQLSKKNAQIIIGNALPGEGHNFSGDYPFYESSATVTIGDGDHIFSGYRAFTGSSATVTIGNGNHIFSGEYAFGWADATVTIGDGDHAFSGRFAFWDYTGTIVIGNGNHMFSGEDAFFSSNGPVSIGNGDHTFGKWAFACSSGTVTIGDGDHTFGDDAFHQSSVTINIGNGNHTFTGWAFHQSSGDISIGDGNHNFSGDNAFFQSSGDISIGDGNHMFSGEDAFHSSFGPISIGDGNHNFSGDNAFSQSRGPITIGDGDHTFSCTYALWNSSAIVIVGNGNYTGLEISEQGQDKQVKLSSAWRYNGDVSYGKKYSYLDTGNYIIAGQNLTVEQ